MKRKNKLKEPVYIEHDLTAWERKSKGSIYRKAKELEEKTGVKPKMKFGKIETQNETWFWNERTR